MLKDIERSAQEKMQHSIEALKKELGTIRTGRATPALLDGVNVEYYGAATPVTQVASVSIPESRSIVIQPWDPTIMGDIEKAILRANLGLTPTNDGNLIRLVIPQLNEDRRKELVKVVHKKVEEARIAVRNVRRDSLDHLRKLQHDKQITDDDERRAQERLQKITDKYVAEVDKHGHAKEQELLEV